MSSSLELPATNSSEYLAPGPSPNPLKVAAYLGEVTGNSEMDLVLGAQIDIENGVIIMDPDTLRALADLGEERGKQVHIVADPARLDPERWFFGGGVILEKASQRVLVDGRPVDATDRPRGVLNYLLSSAGVVQPSEEIFAAVWRQMYLGTSSANSVRVAVTKARKAIAPYGQAIQSIHRQGYVFDPTAVDTADQDVNH
jgi:DNA-binding winged helix-turn-helix (wHTH) protein